MPWDIVQPVIMVPDYWLPSALTPEDAEATRAAMSRFVNKHAGLLMVCEAVLDENRPPESYWGIAGRLYWHAHHCEDERLRELLLRLACAIVEVGEEAAILALGQRRLDVTESPGDIGWKP